MSWYTHPKVEKEALGGVAIWHLTGDWTRDLPLDERRRACADLKPESLPPTVLDLSNLAFLDSWGEETIGNVLVHALEKHGSVAWVFDDARSASYEGIRRALQRHGLQIPAFARREAAMAFLKGTP